MRDLLCESMKPQIKQDQNVKELTLF
jgi:hypothetical protein